MSLSSIRICSDLHLEGFLGCSDIGKLARFFIPEHADDKDSFLVLAGDISSSLEQLIAFIAAVQDRFKKVFFVPGNHELYKHNMQAWNKSFINKATEQLTNTFCTDSESVKSLEIDGILFILGTMWGDGGFNFQDQHIIGRYLNDFRLIDVSTSTNESRRFSVQDMMAISKQQKADIKAILEDQKHSHLKKIVITHHLPSRQLVSERFIGRNGTDAANGGFVSACDDILASDFAPAVWFFGHTHDTIDTKLWDTRLICNPAGYRGEWGSEHNSFMNFEHKKFESASKFIQV